MMSCCPTMSLPSSEMICCLPAFILSASAMSSADSIRTVTFWVAVSTAPSLASARWPMTPCHGRLPHDAATAAAKVDDDSWSRQSSPPPIRPLRAHQAEQQHEDDRHVPQLFVLDDSDPVAAVRDGVHELRRIARPEKAPVGLVGDPLEERRAHGGIEVLGVARRDA